LWQVVKSGKVVNLLTIPGSISS